MYNIIILYKYIYYTLYSILLFSLLFFFFFSFFKIYTANLANPFTVKSTSLKVLKITCSLVVS